MEMSPGEALYIRTGRPGVSGRSLGSTPSPGLLSDEFERLDELWETKWQGRTAGDADGSDSPVFDDDQPYRWSFRTASELSPRPPRGLLTTSEVRLRRSDSGSSLQSRRSILHRIKSWLQHREDKRRGIVYTNSGPCQLFSEWGIPPYPDDYDWDQ